MFFELNRFNINISFGFQTDSKRKYLNEIFIKKNALKTVHYLIYFLKMITLNWLVYAGSVYLLFLEHLLEPIFRPSPSSSRLRRGKMEGSRSNLEEGWCQGQSNHQTNEVVAQGPAPVYVSRFLLEPLSSQYNLK